MQQTLTKFMRPAFKRTISVLTLVADFVEDYKFQTNWETIEFQEWKLPSSLEPHYWCGEWNTRGCLNVDEHERKGKGRRPYIKHYQRSCYRATCKVCYLRWIVRQAHNATQRIEYYSKTHSQEPIHLILSVHQNQHELPVKLLRKRMSHILRIAEFEGGAVIFHPFRFNDKIQQWYAWPHFHLVGFGSKQKITQAFGKYGWLVINEEERRSVFQTFCYLLSHCGVKKRYQTTTWFGKLSYSKMPYEKEEKITKCPVCGGKFIEIDLFELRIKAPPNKTYFGLVDFEDDA